MHERKRISDKIQTLFSVTEDSFEPQLHFKLADEIIQGLDKPNPHLFKTRDVIDLHNKEYDSERYRVGEYFIKYLSNLYHSYRLGFYPKIQIIHWSNKVLGKIDDISLTLGISYKENTAKRISLYEKRPYTLDIGFFQVAYSGNKYHWLKRR